MPTPLVKSWNVHALRLSKNKRYLDKPVQLQFWQLVDDWIRVHKPMFSVEHIAQ